MSLTNNLSQDLQSKTFDLITAAPEIDCVIDIVNWWRSDENDFEFNKRSTVHRSSFRKWSPMQTFYPDSNNVSTCRRATKPKYCPSCNTSQILETCCLITLTWCSYWSNALTIQMHMATFFAIKVLLGWDEFWNAVTFSSVVRPFAPKREWILWSLACTLGPEVEKHEHSIALLLWKRQ